MNLIINIVNAIMKLLLGFFILATGIIVYPLIREGTPGIFSFLYLLSIASSVIFLIIIAFSNEDDYKELKGGKKKK